MKVVELKQRIIEKLQGFGVNPKLLPSLLHARYANSLPRILSCGQGQSVSVTEMYVGWQPPKKNKPHQIHTQHRLSVVKVMTHLVQRLDIRSMECKLVAPKYNVDRGLYIAEIARHTSLSERTVQRTLATLVRSGYIRRLPGQRFIKLSLNLLRHLSLNLAFDRLRQQLLGLDRKTSNTRFGDRNQRDGKQPSNSTVNLHESPAVAHASHTPYQHSEHLGTKDRDAAKKALSDIKGRLGHKTKPPPS